MDSQQQPQDPAFTRGLLEDLVRGTRMSNALPSEDARGFADSFPAFNNSVSNLGPRLEGMMQGFVGQHGGVQGSGHALQGLCVDLSEYAHGVHLLLPADSPGVGEASAWLSGES